MRSPHTLQLIMDSLRYWVTDMHVDGFRFDLASTLARQFHEVDRLAAFFGIVQQDPVISQVKLIAEPWDVGEGGYQVGGFRRCGRVERPVPRHGAGLLAGEPQQPVTWQAVSPARQNLYAHSGRRPVASINFVTAHDGFTLNDLVSYNEKHNEANGEGGADGESHNRSWNCGAEGPTDDEAINRLRRRQRRNFMLTLMLSQGVPMISHGDEIGRTQQGNNNVYCQDNELSWVDWDLDDERESMLEFTRLVAKMRREHPVLRRRRFFAGAPHHGGESSVGDIEWFKPNGEHMNDSDWDESFARSLMVFLNGNAILEPDTRGNRIVDSSMLLLFNGAPDPVEFTIPDHCQSPGWTVAVDTSLDELPEKPRASGLKTTVEGRSIVVLVRPPFEDAEG